MARTVLIVDDVMMNRKILKGILADEYAVIQASNGREAVEIMRRDHRIISVVLLDIVMPVMDGFEVLGLMRESDTLSQLPVIIMTGITDAESEEKALRLGANDYISKPYNPAIIKQRIRNTITLRETATTVNALQRDRLTGLYSREAFYERAAEMIAKREAGYYIMACFDIDKFKVVNDQYGVSKGDEALKHIAGVFSEEFDYNGGICCRLYADNFAALYPSSLLKTNRISAMHKRAADIDWLASPVVFSVGRYAVDDLSLAPSAMYDRAILAANTVKNRYDVHIAMFDESMRERLIYEQEIVTEMDAALRDGQFEVWFQPQYNHSTGALMGAEALARWRHPQKGLISPVVFIPLFEKNGFIYTLDKYVWENVCKGLRRCMDEGREPVPVSVNVSRYDLFRPDVIEVIASLTKRYGIPAELLRIEITESAFAKNTRQIVSIVRELVDRGFTVEIDDFGSGYSSLNTLKDVPAQIIKLDMKFLESGNSERGGNIVESMVRMAKWLGMSVIAEGVETLEQADYLCSIGCDNIQGYLYSKPVPAREYDELCQGAAKQGALLALETVENLDNNAFWDPNSIDTLIFNSYVGGACIYEYGAGKIELLRATDKFAHMLGGNMTVNDALGVNWTQCLEKSSRERFIADVELSAKTKKEVTGEYLFVGLPDCPNRTYLRSTLRVIASAGGRHLVYGINENITERVEAERELREISERLQAIMFYTDCGITAVSVLPDGGIEKIFMNSRYYGILGYTKEQFEKEVSDPFSLIIPEDAEKMLPDIMSFSEVGKTRAFEIRARRRDGRIIWLRDAICVIKLSDIALPVQLSSFTDITAVKERDEKLQYLNETMLNLMNRTPGGFVQMKVRQGGVISAEYCNDGFTQLVGMTRDEARSVYAGNVLNGVHPDDIDVVRDIAAKMMTLGEAHNVKCRLRRGDGGYVWAMVSGQMTRDGNGDIILNSYFTDVTEQINAEAQQAELLDSLPCGAATYAYTQTGVRIVYCNDGFCKLFGGTRAGFIKRGDFDPLQWVFAQDRPALEKQINDLMLDGTPSDCVFRILDISGGFKWINYKAIAAKRKGDMILVNAILLDITSLQNAIERLRMSEDENSIAIRLSGNTICRYDTAHRSLTMSSDMASSLSLPDTIYDVPYEPVRLGKISRATTDAYIRFFEDILHGLETGSAIFQERYLGNWRWVEAKSSTIFSDDGQPVKAVISFTDITDRLEKETVYKKWEQSFMDKDPKSYSLYRCNITKNTVVDSSEGFLLETGLVSDLNRFDAHTDEYAARCVSAEDRERFLAFVGSDALLLAYYKGRRTSVLEYREIRQTGGLRWLRLTVDMVESPHSSEIEAYLLFEDIDEAKKAELATIERAEKDPLTGVLNRATFETRVNAIIQTSRPNTLNALMMLDVDGFKTVNDTFGHLAGDRALIDIAVSLKSSLRRCDLVGRLGGDEFVIFMNDIPADTIAANKAKQICEFTRKTFEGNVSISGSVGITISPRDGKDFETLYKKADAALYMVKGSGKNSYMFYGETEG